MKNINQQIVRIQFKIELHLLLYKKNIIICESESDKVSGGTPIPCHEVINSIILSNKFSRLLLQFVLFVKADFFN